MSDLRGFISPESLLKHLAERRVWRDDETLTAREIRLVFRQILPNGRCLQCNAEFHGGEDPAEFFLGQVSDWRRVK
jgi:hypothetical protein